MEPISIEPWQFLTITVLLAGTLWSTCQMVGCYLSAHSARDQANDLNYIQTCGGGLSIPSDALQEPKLRAAAGEWSHDASRWGHHAIATLLLAVAVATLPWLMLEVIPAQFTALDLTPPNR